MIVKKESFVRFLKECVVNNISGIEEVIIPSKHKFSSNGETYFCKIESCETIDLEMARTVDPLKILFYLSRESTGSGIKPKKRIIAGVKNCDLKALELTDQALTGGNFTDPSYKALRDNTIIISSDCDQIGKSCHCSILGGKPFAEGGFDLNISGIDGDYLVSIGSDKGEELMESLMEYIPFEGTNRKIEENVNKKHNMLYQKLVDQNKKYSIDSISEKLRLVPEKSWNDDSYECVGCGGCTNICPTCYCIMVNDESENSKFLKVKSYDSCQYNGYARVAGGGTPRPQMIQRFRNRYLCKFDYMKSNFDKYGCVGCGRCSDTCPAEIDFMTVISNTNKLAENL